MRGLFVTGTDTGVGKSVLAAALCAALCARGERVAAFKPAVTGLDDPAGEWPPDHELLASAAGSGQSPEDVAPHRYGPGVSPHLAAADAGEEIELEGLLAQVRAAAEGADVLVCEGVGGLLVPLSERLSVRDLAVALGLPLLVAARPGLGTLNHTRLTVEAASAAGLEVRAVVLTPWPHRPEAVEASNRATLARLGVAVEVFPPTTRADLAHAGAGLPLDRLV